MLSTRPSTPHKTLLERWEEMLTECRIERDAVDADPDGQSPPSVPPAVSNLMRRNRGARGGPEGDIHIMGSVHSDRPAHSSTLYKLYSTHTENTGSPRDRLVHLCGYVESRSAVVSWRGWDGSAEACMLHDNQAGSVDRLYHFDRSSVAGSSAREAVCDGPSPPCKRAALRKLANTFQEWLWVSSCD
jgi:hypothetical protein